MIGNLWDLFGQEKPRTIVVKMDLDTRRQLDMLCKYYQRTKQEIIVALILNEKRKSEDDRIKGNKLEASKKSRAKQNKTMFRVSENIKQTYDELTHEKGAKNYLFIKSWIHNEYKEIMGETNGV